MTLHRTILLCALLALTWDVQAPAQTPLPNFSGRWVLNLGRSRSPTFKSGQDDGELHISGCCLTRSLVEVIEHHDSVLVVRSKGMEIDDRGGNHPLGTIANRTTDDADNVNRVAGKASHSHSHWDGARLVTVIDNVFAEVRSLSPDNNTQTVELYVGRREGPPPFSYVMERAADTSGMPGSAEPSLGTGSTHPMQYYVSLPEGWTPAKQWPVVVAIDGSGKDWLDLAHLYAAARKNLPFIIVVPLVLTNGGGDLRGLTNYHYAAAVWDAVDKTGKCKFDLDGLLAVTQDVERQFSGERGVFLTGFSAGAHLMWAMVFQHPERLRGAAPASGNYIGRCMTEETFSRAPTRADLPIQGFEGRDDHGRTTLHNQFTLAEQTAAQHGYTHVSYQIVAGDHEPHAADVLAYFEHLRATGR